MPLRLVELSSLSSLPSSSALASMKSATPADRKPADTYSYIGYVLLCTNLPMTMVGMTLQDLASTCWGE